jgi:Na+/H+-dicarboxylate symporter
MLAIRILILLVLYLTAHCAPPVKTTTTLTVTKTQKVKVTPTVTSVVCPCCTTIGFDDLVIPLTLFLMVMLDFIGMTYMQQMVLTQMHFLEVQDIRLEL